MLQTGRPELDGALAAGGSYRVRHLLKTRGRAVAAALLLQPLQTLPRSPLGRVSSLVGKG